MKKRRKRWPQLGSTNTKLFLLLLTSCSLYTPPHWPPQCQGAALNLRPPDHTPVQRERPTFVGAHWNQSELVLGSSWQQELLLPCRILHLGEQQTVSWIRLRDSLVLSVGKVMVAGEPRFRLRAGGSQREPQQLQDWSLVLSEPRNEDAGLYECQVSSVEPKLSRLLELRLLEADSYINSPNASSILLSAATKPHPLRLTCHIRAPQRTDFVHWYKNQRPIHYQRLPAGAPPEPTGSKQEEQLIESSSSVVIEAELVKESANFTCLPSNAKPSQISVLVIEESAPLQPEKRSLQVTSGGGSPMFLRGAPLASRKSPTGIICNHLHHAKPARSHHNLSSFFLFLFRKLLQSAPLADVVVAVVTTLGLIINYPSQPVHRNT